MTCNHENGNTRLAEQGFLSDTYYCLDCGRKYERLSGFVKSALVVVAVGLLTGDPVSAIAAGMGANGDGDGSD